MRSLVCCLSVLLVLCFVARAGDTSALYRGVNITLAGVEQQRSDSWRLGDASRRERSDGVASPPVAAHV